MYKFEKNVKILGAFDCSGDCIGKQLSVNPDGHGHQRLPSHTFAIPPKNFAFP